MMTWLGIVQKPTLSYDVTPENCCHCVRQNAFSSFAFLKFCENGDGDDGGDDAEADLAATAMTTMMMVMMMLILMLILMLMTMTMTMMMMMMIMGVMRIEESSRFHASCVSTFSTPCMFSSHGLLTGSNNL